MYIRLNFRRAKFAVSLTYFEHALAAMQKKYGDDSAQLISVYQSLGRVSLPALYILWIAGIIWQQLDLFLKQKLFLNRLEVCVYSGCCFAG